MKKHLLLLIISWLILMSTMTLASDNQDDECAGIWKNLKIYWDAYITNPGLENMKKVSKLLEYQECFDSDTVEKHTKIMKRINENLPWLRKRILLKKRDAIRLAYYLDYSLMNLEGEPLLVTITALVKTDPKLFLEELILFREHMKIQNQFLGDIITSFKDDIIGISKKEIEETRSRIKALQGVKEKSLLKFRNVCIKSLKERINYFKEREDIPTNLEECCEYLKKKLEKDVLEEMKNGSEEDMVRYHMGLGRWMRNNWGLWSGRTKLAKYFHKLGVHHPDNMSGIILNSLWRFLNNLPIKPEEQVKQ